jgi:hypothetical protein
VVADSSNLLKPDQPFDICLPVHPRGDERLDAALTRPSVKAPPASSLPAH